jgi:hypothetical protein
MSIKFNTPAEAFMAVAAVALSADGVGTMAERKVLFDQVKSLPVFKNASTEEFGDLCSSVTANVYNSLPTVNMILTTQGIDMLIGAVKDALDTDQRKAAVKMASELCAADGLKDEEIALLSQLEQGLTA